MAEQVKVNATQLAEKWGRRLKQATPDIQRGIEGVRESPMEAAADAQDKMLARLTESVRDGKWARGLRRVSLAAWKDAAITKGIGRIAAGVDGASEKMREFAEQLIDHENAGLSRIAGMPNVTLEDSIQRANAWMRHMAEFTRS